MSDVDDNCKDRLTTIQIWQSTKDTIDEDFKKNAKENYREVIERIVEIAREKDE